MLPVILFFLPQILPFPGPVNSVSSGAACGGNGFAHCRIVTFAAAQAGSSDSTNWPGLISFTEADWATTAHSGVVNNTVTQSGAGAAITIPADWIITTNTGCTTQVAGWEFELYNATTGQVIAWTNVPTLSHTTDTKVYVCYGKASVTTQQMTVASTWNSGYAGVWHFGNSRDLHDSTSNGFTLADQNTTTAATGQIDGAVNFVASSDQALSVADATALKPSHITMQCWLNIGSATTQNNYAKILDKGYFASAPFLSYAFQFNATDGTALNLAFGFTDNTNDGWTSATGTLSTNTWYSVVQTYDGAHVIAYLNGAQKYSNANTRTLSYDTNRLSFGAQFNGGSTVNASYASQNIDECRISNVALSADWLLAEYNSQKSSQTMVTIGAEQ